MNEQSPLEELIDFMIENEGKIDVNDVLIKAELINMRSKPRHAGWYFNGGLYRDLEQLRGRTMSENNHPKPVYFYP